MKHYLKIFAFILPFNYNLEVGVNLRANEITSSIIHALLNDVSCKQYFLNRRLDIAAVYKQTCLENDISFIDYADAINYNAYKFIVLDDLSEVKTKNTLLTNYPPTSPVFNQDVATKADILPHWCPPTYPSLWADLSSNLIDKIA